MRDLIRHESGLEFEHPGSERYSNLMASGISLKCFGTLLDKPQFRTVDEMRAQLPKLDSVRLSGVWVKDRDGKLGEVKGHVAVISNMSSKVYCYASDKYMAVQDMEVAEPLVDVAEERGLKPIGRFDNIGTGRTAGHVVFANPEFRVRLLEKYDDDIMLGVRMVNSYDLSSGVRLDLFGIRMVCINYNLWGEVLGSVYQAHINFDPERLHNAISAFLNTAIDKSRVLSGIAERALNTPVLQKEIEDLTWAISLPKGAISELSTHPEHYCPEIRALGLNAWTLYNAVTAYLTWGKPEGSRHLNTVMEYSRNALDLLTVAHDTLLQRGAERRENAGMPKKASESLRVRTSGTRQK